MPRFSQFFKIGLSQPGLDFVDVPLDADLPVYVDPFAISLYDDELSRESNDAIVAFFQAAINAIRSGNERAAQNMLGSLSEPNETRLGVSRGSPQGRGVSGKQAHDLYKALATSKAAKSGLVSELAECDLFIDYIARDKISDITTNIIRRSLIDYTQAQCDLHGIVIQAGIPSGMMWDHSRHTWREEYTRLPTYRGDKILLVPKNFVRRALSINSQEYLNKHVLEYLQAEHLRAGSSLVEVLVNGKRRVTKVSLRDHYPCTKTWMADFSAEHPEILKTYKTLRENIARVQRQSEADALNVSSNEDYVEATYAQALIENLMRIPAGNDAATEFHNITKGIIEFLFWPSLINPVKEFEIP